MKHSYWVDVKAAIERGDARGEDWACKPHYHNKGRFIPPDRSHASHDMRGTSLESYAQVELGEGQKIVYDALWEHTMRGVYPTDRELTKSLNEGDPNKIRPRRFELMERGLIEEAGKRPCEITGRKALTWRIKRRDKK